MDEAAIVWTDYMKYRIGLRGFDLGKLEHVIRHSAERYVDSSTRRWIVVGRHDELLVMIPYETEANVITPVTVHVTTREQINARIRSGRLHHE